MNNRRSDRKSKQKSAAQEEPAAQAITIAWTSSVVCVLAANIVTAVAHLYARNHPESKSAPVFEAIMLLTACLLGLISLALLPVVWRTSYLKPPLGFTVFDVLVSIAPVIAVAARLWLR
jgi:hypothetical protein